MKEGMTIMLEEQDLADLKAAAERMALPPSVFARSLLLRGLRNEIVKDEVQKAEAVP